MKLRLFLSISALSLGLVIVVVSLLGVQPINAGEDDINAKKLYIGRVLPDHIAYPLLMAMDRFYLETADETERIHKQIEYASRRLFYAQQLLSQDDKEKLPLALSTLTKAEKYLIKASLEAIKLEPENKLLKKTALNSLKYHYSRVDKLSHKFTDSQRSILDDLKKEEKALINQLESDL